MRQICSDVTVSSPCPFSAPSTLVLYTLSTTMSSKLKLNFERDRHLHKQTIVIAMQHMLMVTIPVPMKIIVFKLHSSIFSEKIIFECPTTCKSESVVDSDKLTVLI